MIKINNLFSFITARLKQIKTPFFFKFFILLVLFYLIITNLSFGQSTPFLKLGFYQDFNNYVWQTRFSYITPHFNKSQIIVSESYQANLLETSRQTDKWNDNNLFRFEYLYRLKPWLQSTLQLESTIFSDRQSGFFNTYNTQSLNLGLIGNFKKLLQFKSYLGGKTDERFNRSDNGFHYQLQTISNPFQIADYTNRLDLNFGGDEFRDRKNQDLSFKYMINRQFYKNTFDSLSYQLRYRKKVYYISQNGNLESRQEKEKPCGFSALMILKKL